MCLIDVNDSIAPLCVTSLMRDIVYLQRNFASSNFFPSDQRRDGKNAQH